MDAKVDHPPSVVARSALVARGVNRNAREAVHVPLRARFAGVGGWTGGIWNAGPHQWHVPPPAGRYFRKPS
jgi:hypothetical protein